ncbi:MULTISPECIES: dipeptide ABC transporter ATP-binding protein [Burkholderia]|jgi:glutathione transport system ATP-binding protein|uniref:Glutathione import ATP-binding protein GsiA n=2 Tax=Burkholderia contaminans TaxID=488447 RepID=A0A1E3FX12_9BURK|nr:MULTISPECIES: dipeptide ABC transporter ATP-binding protein [Burkholderia]UTP25407.1 dipeptide ABC transporter ATP-binding protein [Burkholderia sp. FXe9]KKL32954.1 glutathione ABC transporter ATP-binding protein [Burkholderia contaminans LMG 23361]MBA9827639.1 dipeptide ABC transporter ATP-binding protein [Burkholderia contaminans]MBA9836350.1 dipeptide ABC transporter ATP-binding protein [Burkholderia contaminans]MBA9860856.1 dipeptide ABC transporter ATP-binding protein [Burkholderia con
MTSSRNPSGLVLPEQRVVAVDDLSVTFRREGATFDAVRNVSFHVDRGETLAIVGESGSGKSVTSLALMRLVEHGGGAITSGRIAFRRRGGAIVDLAQASGATMRGIRGADIAMIFQEPMTSLNPVFTVGDQISEAIALHQSKSPSEARAETLRLLELVRIPEARRVFARYPHQLSGGMRQRVMIAMALSCRPSLLIADEPTTALDVTIQAQILQLVRGLQDEMNMGVIFITHDMGVVAEVADRVLVMYRGEKVEEGESDRIFAAPEHRYTRALLAAVPKLGSMQGTDAPEKFPLLKVEGTSSAAQAPARAANDDAQPSVDHAASPILRVRDLVTRFPVKSGVFGRVSQYVHAVERVSFELRAGETLALVGESGCGKSTTGRSLLRLVESQSGSIEFDGRDISAMKGHDLQALRRNIQFIFQDPFASLNPRLTVGFSIMEPLLVHGVASGAEAQARVDWLLDKVGLPPEAARRYPHEFSGGQRQRIAIARALALNPKVVIADESVSALDVSVQAQIVNLMLDLQRELGVAYLFISHDMAVVERISHRVAVMYLGQIVEIGPRRAVFEAPQHPYTKKLMSAVPVADPARRHAPRQLAADEIPSPIRAVGDEPAVAPLVAVGPDHYVATHRVGGAY